MPHEIRPRLAPGCRLRDGTEMLMVPESVLRLNNTAQAILSLCDGTRTVAEISKALKFSYSNAPEEVIERGVLDLLFALRERGAVTF